jgi:hypothetical protein
MSDLRLRARSVTEIVDAAFQLYKRDALEYMLVTAVAYAPWVVAQLILLRGLTFTSAQSVGVPGAASFVLALAGIFAYSLMSAVLSRFSSDVYLDRPTGLATVVRAVLPTVPRLIGATFLFGLVLMLGFVPVVVGAGIGNVPLIVGGVLLSFVWAFYAFARFFAVFQVIVLEDRGVMAAFSRSGVLSQNRKGHILLTLFLVLVIFIMLSFAVTMIAQVAGSMAGTVVLQSLYTVVAYPLIGITQMILYYDTRIRAEGFDIELMTGALGSPTATTAS